MKNSKINYIELINSALISVDYDIYGNFKCIRHSFNQYLLKEGVEDIIRMKVTRKTILNDIKYTI